MLNTTYLPQRTCMHTLTSTHLDTNVPGPLHRADIAGQQCREMRGVHTTCTFQESCTAPPSERVFLGIHYTSCQPLLLSVARYLPFNPNYFLTESCLPKDVVLAKAHSFSLTLAQCLKTQITQLPFHAKSTHNLSV